MNAPEISALRFRDADAFYEALLRTHDGLSDEDSQLLDAMLVLALANQVADPQKLMACLAAARSAIQDKENTP